MIRKETITRKTKETDITLTLTLDGSGQSSINSGNGFMNHMLTLFAAHGNFDLQLVCKGDTDVDFHHSAEDIGICLGQALDKALGDRKGIKRYGTFYIPMDEALARVCLDLSGRCNLVYEVALVDRRIGEFDTDLSQDFFKAVSDHARSTIHVDLLRCRNSHHGIEAIFKAYARALAEAVSIDPKASQKIPSSKGVL